MKLSTFASSALLLALVAGQTVVHAQDVKIKDVKHFDVEVGQDMYVPYKGKTEQFKDGFVTGFGSAITFKGLDKDGNPEFWGLTDRGPNLDAPNYEKGEDDVLTSKIFPSPDFTPEIGLISLKDGKATVTQTIPLQDKEGKNITGKPIEPGKVGSSNEVALDEELNDLGYDEHGMDTEGIAVDKDGNFWICDEYGPFMTQFDKDGKQIKQLAPGKGLPEILAQRIPNRGFEGLTITPSGKVVATVQSVLDVEGETSKTAMFTRVVEYDPQTEKVRMFAYPVNKDDYKKIKDCKIGDIFAVSDTKFLVIEQGKDAQGEMMNKVFLFDTEKATDLTDKKVDDKELEFVEKVEDLGDITMGTKTELVDLRKEGWTAEKAEGLALFNDNKTLIVVNDNDFGIKTVTKDESLKDPDITDYTYKPEDKTFSYKVKDVKPEISMEANDEKSQVWTIEFDQVIK
ncbi:esterase-like activity of phytase family protein [Vaginisenegalia massiliensis]|uniref:esterase-like activity of phytase family protein n=1 Tax=Vaginisenegalia massiliensis TaxID=2058294 RepID=UPI000F523FC7|nr:esterase-like activity of phytase family protein [Vaginisenegalia massiliensis]